MPYRTSLFMNPWREVNRLSRMLENFVRESSFASPVTDELEFGSALSGWRPACDIEQTDTHYLVSFDLPGVAKDDLKIEVRDHQLMVSGEREGEKSRSEGETVSRERYSGSFMRSFSLPHAVKPDQVQANLTDGVLRIAIPKGEAAQKKLVPIQSGHSSIFDKLLPGRKKEEKVA